MVTTLYTSPVDKLLSYQAFESGHHYSWADYSELGIGPEHIPELIRMATDSTLLSEDHGEDASEEEYFAPVHAVRALGQLHAEEAVQPLLTLFEEATDFDWLMEDLAEFYSKIGPTTIPTLLTFIADKSRKLYARSFALVAFEEMAKEYPAARTACVAALSQLLEPTKDADDDLNAFIISHLIVLKAVEALPAIKQVFEAGAVDMFIAGDLDDVQVELGLKERVAKPEENRMLLNFASATEHIKPSIGVTGNPYERTMVKRVPDKKSKSKMAKQSRKKNKRQ